MANKRIIEIKKDDKEKKVVSSKSQKEADKAREALLMTYRDQNPHKFKAKGFVEELDELAKKNKGK